MRIITHAALAAIVIMASSVLGTGGAYSATYVYTGNPFTTVFLGGGQGGGGTYTTSDFVTLNVILSAPLPDNMAFADVTSQIMSLTASDGVQSIPFNLGINDVLKLGTSSGEITSWAFSVNNLALLLTTPNVGNTGINYSVISSNNSVSGTFDQGMLDFGFGINQDQAGSWTSQVSQTPLPAALPLFATGLGAFGLFGWWRKRKKQS